MKIELLKDVIQFASTEAAAGLSKLLNEPIEVSIMPITTVNKNSQIEVADYYQHDTQFCIMNTTLVGKISGLCSFILPEVSALFLCDRLLKRTNGATVEFDHMEQSALLELGNIVVGCFLNALGRVEQLGALLHKKLTFIWPVQKSIPVFKHDHEDDPLIVRTAFHLKHLEVDGICIVYFNKMVLSDEQQ